MRGLVPKGLRAGKSRRRLLVLLGICGVWGVVWMILSGPLPLGPLELAEFSLQDTVVRHGTRTPGSDRFVFLAVDEASLDLSQLEPEEIASSPALRLMSEGFPWSREVYALIIEKVLGAGAKVVVLDVHFPEDGPGDAALREVLARHRGRVVIASLFDDSGVGAGQAASQYRPPADSVLPAGTDVAGFANFWPDIDRKVRVAHYRMSESQMLGQGAPGTGAHSSLAALALEKSGYGVKLPMAGLMRFCAPGSFPVVPVWNLFVPDLWRQNLRDGDVFRDKIVLLGPLASRFRDSFRTPLGTLPGPEIHLHAMAAGLDGGFYRRATTCAVMASCLAMALLAFLANWIPRRPLTALAVIAVLLAAYAALALLLFNLAGLVPGLLYPAATLVTAGFTAFAYDFSLERRERALVRRSLERYVSRDVVRELLDHESEVLAQLGGSRREVAVLFSDLRGFTSLSEKADPAELVARLNEYLGLMVDIVFRHGGTLDKFIGDAVLAVWGTVTSGGAQSDATRAVQTACDMIAAVENLGRSWAAQGVPGLALGIGINHGAAIFGNIGSEQKMEPTVIGDTVNLASRLESLTKRYGVRLIVSESVAQAGSGAFSFRTLDTVRVVGRETPVTIYTLVFGADGGVTAPSWLAVHEEGWSHYRARRFEGAAHCFAEVLAQAPADGPASILLERARALQAQPPDDDWKPVHNLESK